MRRWTRCWWLRVSAMTWRSSVSVTDPRNCPEPEPLSTWLTTTEVADLLDMADRGVRKAIERGDLEAEPAANGRWRISRDNAEHYRAARANRVA